MKLILIADDEPQVQRLFKTWLERADYVVLTCNNGQEALDILDKEQVDAVLVDIMMPVMDGLELARALKEDSRHYQIPLIALTGLTNMRPMEESLARMKALWQNWFVDVIPKPCSPDTIFASLDAVFAERADATIQ